MEAGAHLQQACNAATQFYAARGGFGNPAQEFEERGLAGAVPADDPDALALFHLEGDVLQCPEFFLLWSRTYDGRSSQVEDPPAQGLGLVRENVTKGGIPLPLLVGDQVFLAEGVDAERDVRYGVPPRIKG